MADWPIGLSTGCFYHRSIFEVLDPIRESGLSILEVCSSRDHLDFHDLDAVRAAAAEIGKRGLEVFSFHAPFGEDIDISAIDAAQRNHSVEEVLKAVRAAGTVGARYFVLHPGPEQSDRPPPEKILHRLSHAADSLGCIADRCGQNDMALALENMLPHLLFGRTPDLFWLLGSIQARQVGICLDTGHAFLGKTLYDDAEKFSAHLLMMHAADNHGQQDEHLPPGKGDIDWDRLVQILLNSGYAGPVILELAGRNDDSPQTALNQAVEARQLLRTSCHNYWMHN